MKIYANLKMNMDVDDIEVYIQSITKEAIIIPSHIYIERFKSFTLGSQDVSPFKKGSYTGDISAEQLKKANVKYCILGHSERRKYYNESNELLKEKLHRLSENGITPILCVGENENENLEKVIAKQLEIISNDNLIVAYEPVWAIGTGKIPSNEQIEKTVNYIKSIVNCDVLYGGSVDIDNIDMLKKVSNISGFLVGKASCDYKKLNAMVDSIRQN